MHLISGTLHSTPLPWLPVLSNIEPPALWRKAATDKLVEKIVKHDSWPIQPDILSPPLLRLTSRKPLWLDLQPVDIKSRWRHNWKSAQMVNSHLMCDPTIRQPGFDLPRQQWSFLNRFAWNRDTAVPAEGNSDLQTLICVLVARPRWCLTLSSCPLTKLNGSLSRLHSADEDAVSWLTSYGSWHAYEKKSKKVNKNIKPQCHANKEKEKNVQTSQSEYSCRTRVILWQWTVAQTLNYSYQIAFKVPYRPTVVELFYSLLMWDGIAYDVLGLKWISFECWC